MASVKNICIFFAFLLCLKLSTARRVHLEEKSTIAGDSHATVHGDNDNIDITKPKLKPRVVPTDDDEAHSHEGYGSPYYNNEGLGSSYALADPIYRSGSTCDCGVSRYRTAPCLDPPPPFFGCSSCTQGWVWYPADNDGEYETGLYLQREATNAGKSADNTQKKFTVIEPRSVAASRSAVTPDHVGSLGPKPRPRKEAHLNELCFWRWSSPVYPSNLL